MTGPDKPVVLITGAAGNIGSALARGLAGSYTTVGLDIVDAECCDDCMIFDITDDASVAHAIDSVRDAHGKDIAAVVHLAAYFDFTGEDSPLYEKINEDGTARFLDALRELDVGRFIYAGTMLVHEPGAPGTRIDEESPLGPRWAYPQSKLRAEQVIEKHRGDIPVTILRFAGVYDDETAVPTLSQQIARIYENDVKSHLYAGDTNTGQSFVHMEDATDAFCRVVDRADDLPDYNVILVGEDRTESYASLQNRIGALIHGEGDWKTYKIPRGLAKPAAWLEKEAEPVIPDAFDEGERPFIRPFMVDLASDHYELDIARAKEQLGWTPKHEIYDTLPKLVDALKRDPAGWYEKNGITPPEWIESAEEQGENAEKIRADYDAYYRRAHKGALWAHFCNIMLALWLMTAPFILGYESAAMTASDVISGAALLVFAFMSLSPAYGWARWGCGLVGLWLLGAPLVFWAPTASAYMNGTLVGALVAGFAVLTRPAPTMSPAAMMTGPDVPEGWDFSPSSWFQRLPVIALALVGFFVSRYLAAYQLGHIDAVWEPFFAGNATNPKNGTEEIITSSVSKAWPVPDAGLGAVTYMLEILVGIVGSVRRWRTMPWLVVLFGVMIVPLGIVSITFIVIQPIVIGTWCTLCLIAAAAMLLQIPYSLDELFATGEFLWQRRKAGRPWLKIFFTGDTAEGGRTGGDDDFAQPPGAVFRDMMTGGVGLPWNLAACMAIGVWLMFTRLAVGAEGAMANADHFIGAMVLTVTVTAMAETARAVRLLVIPLGFALLITPFLYATTTASIVSSLACAVLLIALPVRRGPIRGSYGEMQRFIF